MDLRHLNVVLVDLKYWVRLGVVLEHYGNIFLDFFCTFSFSSNIGIGIWLLNCSWPSILWGKSVVGAALISVIFNCPRYTVSV